MGWLVFTNQLLHQSLSVLPALLWAAFRLGRRETAGAVLVVAVIGTWGTLRGTGPFATVLVSRNDALLMLQSYLAVLSVSHITIAAVVAERQRAVANLRAAHDELELRVQERTAMLSSANNALREEMAERFLAEERLMAVERKRADSMRELAAFVQAAQEEERRRVAVDLHDDLGQRLAALKLNMHALEQEMARGGEPRQQRYERLLGDVDRIIGEVRRISHNLRPMALDDFGLRVALEMLCKDVERAHGIKTHMRMSGSVPALRNTQVDIALYRIAQGALSNVAKHSGAGNAAVSLAGDERSVVMSVEDDGHGFDVASVRKTRERSGLGLIAMRERAEMLGGSFEITSSVDTGTRVEVVIPLAHQDFTTIA
jgi:signal transduction histidine kinase